MALTVETISHEPIIIITPTAIERTEQEERLLQEKLEGIARELETADHYFIIFEVSQFVPTFSELVIALADMARHLTELDARKMILVVGQDEMIRFGAEALQQEQYGSHNTAYFTTVDDAIAFARQQLVMQTA